MLLAIILIGYLVNLLIILWMIKVTQSTNFGKIEYITSAIPFGVFIVLTGICFYIIIETIYDELTRN